MKHPSSRIAKHRRNSFETDFDTREDDLLLADIKVLPDETGLNITPLDHLIDDQDDIDRLLVNTGFDTSLIHTSQDPDAFAVIDDIKPDDEAPKFDTSEPRLAAPVADDAPKPETAADFQVDGFISTYLAMRPAPPVDEPEIEANDTSAELSAEPVAAETTAPEPEAVDESDDSANSIGIDPQPVIGHFVSGDTETSTRHELAAEPKNPDKPQRHHQSNVISYVVLAIACATLISTIVLGMMVYNMKAEVEKLTGLLAIVKEDMEINSANQDIEPEESRPRKPLK